jgi:GNAT superfamily N-acetyltransferase
MFSYIPLSYENLEEAIALVREVFPDDFDTEDSPEEAYRASLDREKYKSFIDRHHLDLLQYLLVVEQSTGKAVGVTEWYTVDTDPKGMIWLGWYCVDQTHRGKGFGRAILEWTVATVKDMGYTTMRLYTTTDPNEADAQILYEKMGFKLIGQEDEGRSYITLFREKIL